MAVKKVVNKDGIGNPNHDTETGEFASENGGGEQGTEVQEEEQAQQQQPEKEEDALGPIFVTFDEDNIDDWLDTFEGGLTKGERITESRKMVSANQPFLGLTTYNELQLSKEEKVDLITTSSFQYSKEKLENLDDAEIEAIYTSECLILAPKQLKQKLELLDVQKKKLEQKELLDIYADYGNGQTPTITGIWQSMVTVDGYLEKKAVDHEDGTSPIDRKRKYYEDIINDPLSFEDDIQEAQDKLADLNQWVENCEKYIASKEKIQAEYADKYLELDSKYAELKGLEAQLASEEYKQAVLAAREFLDNYQDKQGIYSQFRKDQALWFKGGFNQAYNYLQPKMAEKWSKLNGSEHSIFKEYTNNGFSRFNKPLRGIRHDPGGYSLNHTTGTFSEAINKLTNAIDKCTWDEDMWVQRGMEDAKIFYLPGSTKPMNLGDMTDEELQTLVGGSFTENGFCSCGAGKNTGFTGKGIIFNIFCPIGTKMIYIAPYSQYKTENEMILQRGYSYKITKIEQSGSGYYKRYYIDCEVILDSDENKPVGNKLKELGNKYYYAPRHEGGEAYDDEGNE